MQSHEIPAVSVDEVTGDTFLLDVREPVEWVGGHVEGAQHIPMSALLDRVAEVPRDQDVVVMCRVGARSANVVAYLRSRGWDRLYNLTGGIEQWAAAGRPMISEDGQPARIV